MDDPLYDEAVRVTRELGVASPSYLQRVFFIGYARAINLVYRMANEGVVESYSPGRHQRVIERQEAK